MPSVTVHLPDDLKQRVDETLEYGDSRSGLVQEALERELERREQGAGGDGGENA